MAMTKRTTTKSIAGIALGLTLLGVGIDGAEAAMLDAGRVRVSSSSGVTAEPEPEAARVNLRWEKLTVPFA